MAWTSPRTWVAGEFVTASILNTHVRDNLLDLGGSSSAWAAYTPTITGLPTSANAARWKQYGKLVIAQGNFTASGASTATISWTLPVNFNAGYAANQAIGEAFYQQATGRTGTVLTSSAGPASSVFTWVNGGTAAAGVAQPQAWVSGESVRWSLRYEAA